MIYKKFIGAAAAIALASTPAMAAPSSLSTAVAQMSAPAPAAETVAGGSDLRRRTGIIIPLAVILAIGAAIYFLVIKDDDPKSA